MISNSFNRKEGCGCPDLARAIEAAVDREKMKLADDTPSVTETLERGLGGDHFGNLNNINRSWMWEEYIQIEYFIKSFGCRYYNVGA